jgi:hypothetical protein
MKIISFPWLAMGIGLVVALVLNIVGATKPAEEHLLPLLTMLLMSEFGFFVSVAGAISGMRAWLKQRNNYTLLFVAISCAVLAIGLLLIGIVLWKGNISN